jgi:hypothetical protein
MNISSLETGSIQTASVQLARLSRPHGYRFDGDTVHLNAMFALLNPAAHECSWALQLWACPSAPASAQELAGHLVAEVALPPMGELADESEHFEVSALAWPPAGAGEHVMVLVLVSRRPGQTQEVQDLAVYSRPQQFSQPQMRGNVGYRIDGTRVQISVDRVENPRSTGNRSGTLSLELWALPSPYAGGRFQGHHLAGVELGFVDGQIEVDLQPQDLAFRLPPAGDWQIVLMLREWTAAGYVTRDFTNFATRFVSAAIVERTPEPVVGMTVVLEVARPAAPVAGKPFAPVLVIAPAPVTIKAPAAAPASAVVKALAPAAPVAPAKAPVSASAKGVSVNNARVEELAAVKGLSARLAAGIVRKRPFASLDDLREVKGIGAKILARVRSSLRL